MLYLVIIVTFHLIAFQIKYLKVCIDKVLDSVTSYSILF
jgi:hypothetical protein